MCSYSTAGSSSKALVGEYDPEGRGARGRRDLGKQEKGQRDVRFFGGNIWNIWIYKYIKYTISYNIYIYVYNDYI